MQITSPRQAARFFRQHMAKEIEEFWIAALTTRKEIKASACLFRGTVDHCLFHPRDVFRFACAHNSSAFIVAHNHPSNDLSPSEEDSRVTRQLLSVSLLLEIPMVDHLIIGRRGYYSFLQNGGLKLNSRGLAEPCDQ